MWGGVGWGGLGVIIESNLNRVRLSCCWVGVGLGCDNNMALCKYFSTSCTSTCKLAQDEQMSLIRGMLLLK